MRRLNATRRAGSCVFAIGNAHHNGPLWLDVETFADAGLITLSVVNSATYVVPFSARKPVYGTKPMAFAVPRADGSVLMFDQATAAMANGEVRIAAKEGRQLPEGVGLDAQGQPTRDPLKVLDGGALLPFGGHKGSQIAMMIDLLAGALTGSNFSHQVDWSGYPGAESAYTGQTFIVIDPAKANSATPFSSRVEELVRKLSEAGQTRLPGDTRKQARARSEAEGIKIDAETYSELLALA
ncbi:Ldh family oxidoreductase (plasmid) [Salipiger sp. H15]|uniref:Ldh family oxidoreductase n=1 Tax=Alloyangia sp. H15 TaxID=3029062 RepID=A0AAU8ARW6_9RHOB